MPPRDLPSPGFNSTAYKQGANMLRVLQSIVLAARLDPQRPQTSFCPLKSTPESKTLLLSHPSSCAAGACSVSQTAEIVYGYCSSKHGRINVGAVVWRTHSQRGHALTITLAWLRLPSPITLNSILQVDPKRDQIPHCIPRLASTG